MLISSLFAESSLPEIIEYFKPRLLPHSFDTLSRNFSLLMLFLPTNYYKIFDYLGDLIGWSTSIQRSAHWNRMIFEFFSRIVSDHPHVYLGSTFEDFFFQTLLKTFQLPVGMTKTANPARYEFSFSCSAFVIPKEVLFYFIHSKYIAQLRRSLFLC